MSSEQMKNSFANCPPCLLAEMAKKASLVAGPPKCYINQAVYIASYKKPLDQLDFWKLFLAYGG